MTRSLIGMEENAELCQDAIDISYCTVSWAQDVYTAVFSNTLKSLPARLALQQVHKQKVLYSGQLQGLWIAVGT